MGYFEGYTQGHNLTDWGMGSGRVFTKALLNQMTSGFAKGNRSMDQSIKGALKALDIDPADRLLTDPIFTYRCENSTKHLECEVL